MRIKTDKSQFEMEDEDVEKNKEETIETEITTRKDKEFQYTFLKICRFLNLQKIRYFYSK
jgi:hypothetical protein